MAALRRLGGAGMRRNLRGSPGSVAEWTPASLANLEGWYRADDVVVSGNSITTWTNRVVGGHDLTQATGTAQPTKTTRAGQAVASFDGGDYMQVAFGHTHAQPITVYVVGEPTAGTLTATRIWFDGDDATNRCTGSTTATPQWSIYAGGTPRVAGTPTAAIHAGCWEFNGASSTLHIDDFRSGQAIVTGLNPGGASLDGFTIGAAYNASAFFSGYIWEIIVALGAHDAATRALVGAYFNSRYSGLSVTV